VGDHVNYFRIKGLCRALDGLTVEVDGGKDFPLLQVQKIFNTNQVVGDREFTVPVEPGGLIIHNKFLEPTDDPTKREYAHDNPYGKFILESRTTVGETEVAFSRFEKALQVTIREVGQYPKTLYTENFNMNLEVVQGTIVESGIGEIDDLIFVLQEMKEAETSGQA
jgi:hypothetical protein